MHVMVMLREHERKQSAEQVHYVMPRLCHPLNFKNDSADKISIFVHFRCPLALGASFPLLWTPRDKLQDSLAPILRELQIHVFEIRKAVGKTCATLTIADTSKAQNLLAQANANPDSLPACRFGPERRRVTNQKGSLVQ
jgi:hypothetical protein